MNFKNTKLKGANQPRVRKGMNSEFSLVSNNPKAVKAFKDCKLESTWNVYYCAQNNIGLLYFDSLDADTWDRSVQPITITDEKGYSNVLNSFMDHVWDGFYTGQVRLSRFPAVVEVDPSNQRKYTIEYTGTPPGGQRFTLDSDTHLGIIIRINYPKTGSYSLTNVDNG